MHQAETKRLIGELLPFIRHHRLEAGDRLPSERDLAARFKVSRGTVREAITALEALRVVERRPNSGIYLQPLAREASLDTMVMFEEAGVPLLREEVEDAVEMRRILEVEAIRMACERRMDGDLEKLNAILDRTAAKLTQAQPIGDEDVDFHLAIIAATRNRIYPRIVNSFYLMSKARRDIYFQDADQCRKSFEQHRKLFSAIELRDAAAAVRLMQDHLTGVKDFWRRTFDN